MALQPLQVEKAMAFPRMSLAYSQKKDFGTELSFSWPDFCARVPIILRISTGKDQLEFQRGWEEMYPRSLIKFNDFYRYSYVPHCPSLSLAYFHKLPFPGVSNMLSPNLQSNHTQLLYRMDILEKNEYFTDDPYVKQIINDQIQRQMITQMSAGEMESGGKKKGKSAHQQTLFNLRNNDGKFKYLWAEGDGQEEIDYQQEENKRRRDRDLEMYEPPRFKILGYATDRGPGGKLRKRPILKMSDLYLTNSAKVRRLINRVFERHVYGREGKRGQGGQVILATTASNASQLQAILSSYERREEDYGFQNQQLRLQEDELEEYIIDRGQSKQNYFLFYKNQLPPKILHPIPQNNPLKSELFIKQLHAQVAEVERRTLKGLEEGEDETEQGQQKKEEGRSEQGEKQVQKKEREYFGQFRQPGKERINQKFTMEDGFASRCKASEALASSIIDSLSFLDNQTAQQRYLKPIEDRLQLNLANPLFFQPKLHTILNRQRDFFQDQEYRQKLAEANKGSKLDVSLLSGLSGRGKSKLVSAMDSQAHEGGGNEQQHLTIEKVIQTEIKNVYREPLKHSEVATKFDFVKFTFEEECFSMLHRFNFNFHQHLAPGRVRVQLAPHKTRRPKPNGLVINSEMRESNDKFSRKEDLSLVKGEFTMIEYIQESPLLLSDVGMCERMIIQVNYLELLEKVNAQALQNKSFQEMEEQRDIRKTAQALSFEKHCDLWRKCIRDTFGENGKQFFWEPKYNSKLIGIPDGPGVTLMESNLANVPIVKKKPNPREFLLVREGKRWVLRRIQSLYVSGQVQPHKKVFCPGSRNHTQFKGAYEKAFIVKQVREYGSVNFDQLKLAFKGETENSLRRALKNSNTTSKDSKLYRLAGEEPRMSQNDLTPEQVCLYQRMQRSLCQLRQVGITDIKTNEKMKNVLKEFNRKHFMNQQKITIARMIREQLQLTSWYLSESFLKFKMRTSKIEINGFADPTNGRGGYSYINKPQKERTSKEDMQERAEKQRTSTLQDLRKLKVDDSKERLRAMGHNEDEIDFKGRWQLINLLKNKQGTQFSRRQRETKCKKIQNQRKEVNKNFNRLLDYLNDKTEQPMFNYSRTKKNRLEDYILREKEYYEKIKRKYSRPIDQQDGVKAENQSDDSDDDD